MALPDDSLPANVRDAIRGGNKMEAIRRLRQAAGLGLAEAKERIDAHVRHAPVRAPTMPHLSKQALDSVAAAMQRGSVFEAIRLIREDKGLGLKEAKEAIEPARPSYLANPDAPPDTFHRVVTGLWWILALALAGSVAYYFIRGG